MRGEGTQVLFNALLIANIGEHLIEHSNLAAPFRRNMQPRLRHKRQQSNCLQHNSFPTRVWAGDHERVEPIPKINICWHNALRRMWICFLAALPCLLAHIHLKQRMLRLNQSDEPMCIEQRLNSVIVYAKPRLCCQKV